MYVKVKGKLWGGGLFLEGGKGGQAESRAPVQDTFQPCQGLFIRSVFHKPANVQSVAQAASTLAFCGSKTEEYEKEV